MLREHFFNHVTQNFPQYPRFFFKIGWRPSRPETLLGLKQVRTRWILLSVTGCLRESLIWELRLKGGVNSRNMMKIYPVFTGSEHILKKKIPQQFFDEVRVIHPLFPKIFYNPNFRVIPFNQSIHVVKFVVSIPISNLVWSGLCSPEFFLLVQNLNVKISQGSTLCWGQKHSGWCSTYSGNSVTVQGSWLISWRHYQIFFYSTP